MRICFFTLLFLVVPLFLTAQTSREEVYGTPEKSGGVYYAYPSQDIVPQTPAPEGYKPFYISHLGRHGSRYLINHNDYKRPLTLLADAQSKNALTPLGSDVYARLQKVWLEVEDRGGDLSPLGVREQRGIAERMYQSFPEVFTDETPISARSTMVVRCVLSMDAFCERLKELNPTLNITREASEKYVRYLNHHTPEAIAYRSSPDTWREEYYKFEEAHYKPERLVNSLFSDKEYVTKRVNMKNLMFDLFQIANNMQNIETDACFYDLFEKEKLFDLFQCVNYGVYVQEGNAAINGGIMIGNAKPLLRNILESAEEVISKNSNGATLRFAHDGNLAPLAIALHLNNCYNSVADPEEYYKAFSIFKVAPMGSNIQMIFFRKEGSDDILVKFMHNEIETTVPPIQSDILPYYHWEDVKAFYELLL
ncbi:MAG: histidine-type phosphatase [Tannerellaceae bacterium]|nr:histidine-type phosphatase [Tannerellaceae bacterium]MCD8263647.1 histidine-type phosphatase [Tannerellaceae bacterium]